MSTTFAETTELELVVLPVAMGDDEDLENEDGVTDDEEEPNEDDLDDLEGGEIGDDDDDDKRED